MTKEEIIEECKQRLGFETDYEMYSLCKYEMDFYNAIIEALEQQPGDESIKYLECNDIDVQKFTEALKMQPLQIIKPNTSADCVSRAAVDQNIYDYAESNGLSYVNLKNAILDVPPVTPTQRWIPVSERLPKQEVEVLTSNEYGFIEIQSLEDGYWENQFGDCEDLEDSGVVVWQPLPKPYEEKRGSENESINRYTN